MAAGHHDRISGFVDAHTAVEALQDVVYVGLVSMMLSFNPVQTSKAHAFDLFADFDVGVTAPSDMSRGGRDVEGARHFD
jgi:hypothetical protein